MRGVSIVLNRNCDIMNDMICVIMSK